MKFKSTRNFDMSPFGWTDCKFTFNALSWGEMRNLDSARKRWAENKTDKEVEDAALEILEIMKSKFVSGQALDDTGEKVSVTIDDFDDVPFDIFLKLVGWVTSGEVDQSFLAQ